MVTLPGSQGLGGAGVTVGMVVLCRGCRGVALVMPVQPGVGV